MRKSFSQRSMIMEEFRRQLKINNKQMNKNIFSIFACLLSLGIGILQYSCQNEDDMGSFTPITAKLKFASDEISVTKADSAYEIKIRSNLPWRVKTSDTWVSIKDSTSFGKETDSIIVVRISKNPVTAKRTGTLTAWITKDVQKTFTIIQDAGDPPPIVKRHVYVKEGGSGNGTTWGNATSLDGALAQSLEAGDFIHIAAGIYKPAIPVTGGLAGADADKTFEIKENIVIIGGYPANPVSGAVSNPSVNLTTFDGNGTANHVVTVTAPNITGRNVTLRGITIKKGSTAASGSVPINGIDYPKNYGGGIIIGKSALNLKNCIISENVAVSGGGGVYAFTSATLTMDSCSVNNNSTSSTAANGGGMFIDKQSVLFINNSAITSNAAGSFGGGLYIWLSNFHVFNSTIDGNGAGGLGSTTAGKAYGGAYVREGSRGEFVNCTVFGNTSSNIGGGIGIYGTASAPTVVSIISNTISGNKIKNATAKGGGIYVNAAAANATLNIYNSIISGNTIGVTGTENISDVDGAVGYAFSKKQTVVSNQVFDNNGTASGLTFEFAAMLGAFANNGGVTKSCLLTGANNPAKTSGMSTNDLATLGGTFSPAIPSEIISADQIGGSRNGKPYIGACVK